MASGFAWPFPAMSGALPWIGSYSPTVPPSEAEGSIPIDPVIIDASSVRMSPKRFVVTITSNCFGYRTSCMAQLSTSMWASATSGNSRSPTSVTTFLHNSVASRTFALSTEVTLPARFRASSKATRATRSISGRVYTSVLIPVSMPSITLIPRGSPK